MPCTIGAVSVASGGGEEAVTEGTPKATPWKQKPIQRDLRGTGARQLTGNGSHSLSLQSYVTFCFLRLLEPLICPFLYPLSLRKLFLLADAP